jgi:hypothetical protein
MTNAARDRVADEGVEHVFNGLRDSVGGVAYTHHAPSAGERHRRGFVGEAGGIALEHIGVEFGQAERIGIALEHGLRQQLGTLAHQTGVGTVHEHSLGLGVGRLGEGVGSAGLNFHHGLLALRLLLGAVEIDRHPGADFLADLTQGARFGIALGGDGGVLIVEDIVGHGGAHTVA